MEYFGWSLVLIGCLFNVVSIFGCIKMPDIYTKLHAAGISDSCGSPLAILGLICINGVNLVSLKMVLMIVLLLIITPAVTNIIFNIGLEENIKPKL